MKNQLNIPSKIRVGCVERSDTYTKRLGYVIYYDEKGKLRKETSFESWRDKKIPAVDYDNVPTEGFVLNKKAGGYSSGWNQRATYCRIFDPRGFEFEITIPNLLFILQETNSIKGKGLEGEFVYSWEGKDIVLLPVSSQEYKSSAEFTSLKTMKVTKEEVIEGHTYLCKDEKEVIYLGRHDWLSKQYNSYTYEKKHIFVYVDKINEKADNESKYMLAKGFTDLAKKTGDEVGNYAELFDSFSKSKFAGKPSKITTKDVIPNLPKCESYWSNETSGNYFLDEGNGVYTRYRIKAIQDRQGYSWNSGRLKGYELLKDGQVVLNDKTVKIIGGGEQSKFGNYGNVKSSFSNQEIKLLTKTDILGKPFKSLTVVLDNGKQINF